MSRKKSFLVAFIINVIFLVIYICVLQPVYETNDDLAMSFFVEGVFGEQSAYMVYQNIFLGKLLCFLYKIVPGIKWYNLLLYIFLFASFTATSYVFLRMLPKRKSGIILSILLLIVCGYSSYVIFQYSRIASQVSAGGLILLCYAIKYGKKDHEQWKCYVVGGILSAIGSMIRFKMFALTAVLIVGVTVLHEVWEFRKRDNWSKELKVYVCVFGGVALICLSLFWVDKMHYDANHEWSEYQKFNELRTELWDYGFPDYDQNEDAFNDLGISKSDYEYYLTWNMDEEVMTIEKLESIVNLKSKKEFRIMEFLRAIPKVFLKNSCFIAFTILALIAVSLDRRNFYFIASEALLVVLFEAYFFYSGRYGIPRIDCSMWMAAAIVLLYGIAQNDIKISNLNWGIKSGIVVLIITLCINNYFALQTVSIKDASSSKEIYKEILKDDEHLYVLLVSAPEICYNYDFWEPSKICDFSNIYEAYGWDFNMSVRKNVLKAYGISNIYRDSINNEQVYFVTDAEQGQMLQKYITENYDKEAKVILEKRMQETYIWSVYK